MAAVAAPERTGEIAAEAAATERLFDPAGGATLEARVLRLWDELGRDGVVVCPVCAGKLRSTGCECCGSELS